MKPFHSQIPDSLFSKLPPIYHPKAIALIISANSYLYEKSGDKTLIGENMQLVELLNNLRNCDYEYACWGHPFEWGQSPRYPYNTPLVCVQAPILNCLIDFYNIYPNEALFNMINSAVNYLLYEAEYDTLGVGSASFRNSPLNKMYVHNSNIMTACLFYRLENLTPNDEMIKLADQLIVFTIDSQNIDGSWFYSPDVAAIDNRHTGFILYSLHQLYKLTNREDIFRSMNLGLNYYKTNLFENSLPKWSPNETYPIDIHDVAQAIITFSEIGEMKYACNLIDFAINKMSNGKDEFYYKYFKDGRVNRAVFIRWGQAWMMVALTMFLKCSFEQNSIGVNKILKENSI